MCNLTYIENVGVNVISTAINKTKKINPMLRTNDKTPLWDGDLFIYNNENWKKENIKYVIPVQIKTRTYKVYKSSFTISRKELEKFILRGGLIYFVVEIINEKIKVFYSVLTKIDIELYKIRNSQGTIKILLEEFPVNEPKLIYNICDTAGNLINKNNMTLNNVFSFRDAVRYYPGGTVKFYLKSNKTFSSSELISQVMIQQPHIYYIPKGMNQEFVVDKFCDEVRLLCYENNEIDVYVENEKVFDNIKILDDGITKTYYFGKYVSFKYGKDETGLFSYDLKGDIFERINIAKFVLCILEKKGFVIDGKKEDIVLYDAEESQIVFLKQVLKNLDKMKKIIERLGISKIVDLDSYSKKEIDQINILYNALFQNATIEFAETTGYYLFDVAGLKLILFVEKVDETSAKVYNFFDYDCNFRMKESNEKVSNYLLIGSEYENDNLLNLVDNIDFDRMVKEICVKKEDKNYFHEVNSVLLSIISHYDKTNNIKSLEAAERISEFLLTCDENNIVNRLNWYQIKKRKSSLSMEDMMHLAEIKNESDNDEIKLAASVLMGNYIDAKYFWDAIPDSNKKEISKWPIYALYQEL